jgi:hypothetical protein
MISNRWENRISISVEMFDSLIRRLKDLTYSGNIAWTDDFTVELPIKRVKEGVGSIKTTQIVS